MPVPALTDTRQREIERAEETKNVREGEGAVDVKAGGSPRLGFVLSK